MEGQQHRAEKREGKNSATDAGNESVATTAADLHCNHRILSRRHALIRDCHHRRLQCVQCAQCAQDTQSVCMFIPRHAWSRYTIRKIRGENTVEVALKTSGGGEASEIESVARVQQASGGLTSACLPSAWVYRTSSPFWYGHTTVCFHRIRNLETMHD